MLRCGRARCCHPIFAPRPHRPDHLQPQTRYYGFTFHFEGQRVHHKIDTFETLELAMRWADRWGERIWEEPSDADESAVLMSRRKRAGEL